MNSKRDVFLKGISVQSIITVIMGILEILVFAIMSRLLSKEDFGYFAVLTGIMAICISITEAGLGASVIQKKDASEKFISTAFTLSILLGFGGMTLVSIMASFLAVLVADENIKWPLRIMSINIFLACISSLGRSILVKQLKFSQVGIISIVAYTCSSVVGIAMAIMGYGLWAIVCISILNLLLFNILLYAKCISLPKLRICKKEVRKIVSYGGWLTMGVLVNNITQQMDKLVLSKWISVSVLGAYNRPAGFVTNITSKINGIFDTVLFPMLSNIQDDRSKVQEIFIRAIKLLNSFAIILFSIFFFNAELIIRIFFGMEWSNLVPILQIISIYIIFNVDNRLVDCFFRSLDYVKLGFRLRVVSTILTFCFLYLGAKNGIYGVAISLVSANVLTVILKVIFLSLKVQMPLNKVFIAWIQAERSLIPLLIIGIPFLLYHTHNLMMQILFAFIMTSIIVIEFILFPSWISKEYQMSLYPTVVKFLNKNLLHRNCRK